MRKPVFQLAIIPLVLLLSGSSSADLSQRQDVQQFIGDMVTRHQFSAKDLNTLFQNVVSKPKVVETMTRPAESKPWYQYRPLFVNESRIQQGVEFWRANADVLKRAEAQFGVPASVIVAILGVETRYGRHQGHYRVIDSLATLAFDYPPRASFFRGQLEQFLLMAREESIDPLSLTGSYAGAMGQPQFIASSFRTYAIDFDGDGHRDLWNDTADVVGSVANYFARHHWQPGEPIASPARMTGISCTELVARGYAPSVPVSELSRWGVVPEQSFAPTTQAAVIALDSDADHQEFWVTLDNFYAITRYNHSPLYAMAVYQLGEAIRARLEKDGVSAHAG